MIYNSTRNNNLTANSAEAVLKGIADDGGLFMIKNFDALNFNYKELMGLPTIKMSQKILHTLLNDFSKEEMDGMVNRAYMGKFATDELTPTVKVGDFFVTELFHGPTSAFKDVALSVLPQLMAGAKKLLNRREETVILTATSGDTGKAALEGFANAEGIRIIVFFPNEGVSAVQKAQMVTQTGENVCVCAINGNFDDAQTGVKNAFAAFNQKENKKVCLSSANSINIGRLAPQLVYYFKAYSDLLEKGEITMGEKINFVVPTGNFGNILAGYLAKCLGLPINKLVCASNANNVLTDFLTTGVYDRRRTFYKTVSPSMDILVSSNLERLLYLLSGGNDKEVAGYMKDLNEKGFYKVSDSLLNRIKETFAQGNATDEETLETIKEVYDNEGYLCDTHTAVAVKVLKDTKLDGKSVVLSTASPYKFPTSVLTALGETPNENEFLALEQLNKLTGIEIPKRLAELKNAAVLHKTVIEKNELIDFVFSKTEE